MSSFGRHRRLVQLLATLVGIETLESLGISTANVVTTTENMFVTTEDGRLITSGS
jgi:hypothetical protein